MTGKSYKETPGTPFSVQQAQEAAAKTNGVHDVLIVDIATEIWSESFDGAKHRCLTFVREGLKVLGSNTLVLMIFEGTVPPYKEVARDKNGRQTHFSTTELINKHLEKEGIHITEGDTARSLHYVHAQRAVLMNDTVDFVLQELEKEGFVFEINNIVGILATTEAEQTAIRALFETQQIKSSNEFRIGRIYIASEDSDIQTLAISLDIQGILLRRFNFTGDSDDDTGYFCLALDFADALDFYNKEGNLFSNDRFPQLYGLMGGHSTSDFLPGGTHGVGDARQRNARRRAFNKLTPTKVAELLELKSSNPQEYINALRDFVVEVFAAEMGATSDRSMRKLFDVTTIGTTGLLGPVITNFMRPILDFMLTPSPQQRRNVQPHDFVGFSLGVSRLAHSPSPRDGEDCLWKPVDAIFRNLADANRLQYYMTGDCGLDGSFEDPRAVLSNLPYSSLDAQGLRGFIETLHVMLLEEKSMPGARSRCLEAVGGVLDLLGRVVTTGEVAKRPLGDSDRRIPRWLLATNQREVLDIMNLSSMDQHVKGVLSKIKGSPDLLSSPTNDASMHLSVVLQHGDFDAHPANHGCQPSYVMHYQKCAQQGGNEQRRVDQPGFTNTNPVVQLLEASQGDIGRIGFIGEQADVFGDDGGLPVPKLGVCIDKAAGGEHNNFVFTPLTTLDPSIEPAWAALVDSKFEEFEEEVNMAKSSLEIQQAAERLLLSNELVSVVGKVDAFFKGAKEVGLATKTALENIVLRVGRDDLDEDDRYWRSRAYLHSMPLLPPVERLAWLAAAALDQVKQSELKDFAPIWPFDLKNNINDRLEQKAFVSRYLAVQAIHKMVPLEDGNVEFQRVQLKIASNCGADKRIETSRTNSGSVDAIETALQILRAPCFSVETFQRLSDSQLDETVPLSERHYVKNRLLPLWGNLASARPSPQYTEQVKAFCNELLNSGELACMGRRYSLPLSLDHFNAQVAEITGLTAAETQAQAAAATVPSAQRIARQKRMEEGKELRIDFTDQQQVNVLKMVFDRSSDGIDAEKQKIDYGIPKTLRESAALWRRILLSDLCPQSIRSNSRYPTWIANDSNAIAKRKAQLQRCIIKVATNEWNDEEVAGREAQWRRGRDKVVINNAALQQRIDDLLAEAEREVASKERATFMWPIGAPNCDTNKVMVWFRILEEAFAHHGLQPFSVANPDAAALSRLDASLVEIIQRDEYEEAVSDYLSKYFRPRTDDKANRVMKANRLKMLKTFAKNKTTEDYKWPQIAREAMNDLVFPENPPNNNV